MNNTYIFQLEDEVQRLTQRLQDQIEEERLVLMRRERESQEGQNLELMLKSDLERVNDDRYVILWNCHFI